MTTTELISKLKNFPPDTEVGGIGHFGGILELEGVEFCDRSNMVPKEPGFAGLRIESAGEEPK
jgi:hypothetical protein